MSFTAGQKLRASQMPGYVCTSSTRPVGHQGQIIFETDTGFYMWYNGSDWDYFQATAWVSHEAEYYASSAQTIPTATDRPLSFDTAVTTTSDVTRGTSTAGTITNAKFTLNRAGIWTINASMRWNAPNSGSVYGIWIGPDNSTTRYTDSIHNSGGTTASGYSCSVTRRFAATDTIVVNAFQNSGGNEDTQGSATRPTSIRLTWMRP